MAVYKIFPSKDATIYSEYPSVNTGLDAILDLSKSTSFLDEANASVCRSLIKFSTYDINKVITSYITTGSFSASLKMYLANTENIPTEFDLEVRAVSQDWDMGTGKYEESPIVSDGVTWSSSSLGQGWVFGAGSTGSYKGVPGGGSWVTGSVYTQSFGPYTSKDIDINVTGIVKSWISASYGNYGFIVKNSEALEFNKNYKYTLQYFSRDTHTIYPPSLDIKWDDSQFSPSNPNKICSNGNINVSLQNSNFSYREDSICKIRINVRDKFPTRTFSTTSLYTNNKYLPSSSYWSLIDYKTKDIVIDFDDSATKISADVSGSYFTLFMNGLEPARYYEVLIKSVIGNEVLIFDNDYIFKVE